MATTKVITDLTEFNPGNPDYVLNATNAVTVSSASGSNKYYFDGVYDGKFGLRIGTTVLTGIPSGHPFTIMNNGKTSQITISGSDTVSGTAPNGDSYTFYYNTATITVLADFGTISYACSVHGYMGGENNFVSVYSEAGLRMPTGSSAYAAPPAVAEGMMRNEVGQQSEGSASCMQHFNGTDWKNFVNVNSSTLNQCNYPTTALALYQLNDNAADTCNSNQYPGTWTGTESYVNGNFGKAASFSNGSGATSNYISLPSFMPTGSNSRSISMWIKTASTSYQELFTYGSGGNNNFFIFRLPAGGTQLGVDFYNNGHDFTATNITDGNWHNCAATYDGNLAKVYYDGVLIGTGTAGSVSTGASNEKISGYQYTGSIDQVRLFSSALTPAQVEQLYLET